jgi:hypothetical protein
VAGDRVVATVFVQAAVEQAEQGRLAGAVAPHQADLLAGVEGDGALSSSTLAPRRKVTFLRVIMGEMAAEGRA